MSNDRMKFRVWNQSSKSFVDSDMYGMNLCGDLFYFSPSEDGVHLSECDDYTVIEQCTGLKDKNGTLIYEGDIVRAGNDKITAIGYRGESCSFCHTIIGSKHSSSISKLWCETYSPEIIGNIHENPELIEATK